MVDRLTKLAHFIPVAVSYISERLAEIYIREIVHLHGVLLSIISDKGSWDLFLPLAEFAYNNSYQSSIQMPPYEALYGRWCRLPVGWFELRQDQLLCIELVQDALVKVKIIQDRFHTAQSKQKSYTDRKVRDVAFMVGERVFLRVSPMNGVMRFRKKDGENTYRLSADQQPEPPVEALMRGRGRG
ncbi:uncharacterized protein [Nicotiana sylvestris]|uniref:uncharacterized protein n=1 Tax=Nicotiana sylvestris TaxID=4096 RepID=UPI00388CD699